MCKEREHKIENNLDRRNFLKDFSKKFLSVGFLLSKLPEYNLSMLTKVELSKKEGFKLKKRKLGRTNLLVSEIGLGGHYNGLGWQEKDSKNQDLREVVVRKTLEYGINYFDTNDDYERKSLGLIFKKMPGIREKIYLVADINDKKENKEETKRYLLDRIDEQLKMLQVDYVDVMRFTCIANKTPDENIKGAIEAFQQMKKDGKARFLAVAQHDPDLLLRWINKWNEFDIIYTPYSYLIQRAQERLFPEAKKKNIGIICIKPFAKGTLFKFKDIKELNFGGSGFRDIRNRLERESRDLKDLMMDENISLARATLKFILSNDNISTVIPGMETPEEVSDNVLASGAGKIRKSEINLLERSIHGFDSLLPENYLWLKKWKRC